MKILLGYSENIIETYFNFIKGVKEKYPSSTFIFNAERYKFDKFIDKDGDIFEVFDWKEFVNFDWKNYKIVEKDIDKQALKEFEKMSPNKSIWDAITADRRLGRSFLQNIEGYDFEKKNDKEYILHAASKMIKGSEKMLLKCKPDIYIAPSNMSSLLNIILKNLCKKLRILYIVMDSLRIQNYCAFTEELDITFPEINKTYQEILKTNNQVESQENIETYNKLLNEYENKDYFDANNKRINSKKNINIFTKLKILFLKIPLMIIKLLFKSVFKPNKERFASLISIVSEYIQRQLQIIKLNNNKSKNLNENQKYIYYPLHVSPEYSTLYQGRHFANQLIIIEALAKSIPHDWVVYVKEHPAIVEEVVRSKDFYNRINQLPNVCLIPVYSNSYDIVKKAEMIAIINGTAGWEGILNGKPVIHFGEYLFSMLNLSTKCTDLSNLSNVISEETKRIKNIYPNERKKRILALIEAVKRNGFWMSYPNQFFYVEPSEEKHHITNGKEFAAGFIKYINFLKKEKKI